MLLTSVVSTDEALQGRGVKGEGSTRDRDIGINIMIKLITTTRSIISQNGCTNSPHSPAYERLVEGALHFAGDVVLDVVHHGVQVAGVGVLARLIRASELTCRKVKKAF